MLKNAPVVSVIVPVYNSEKTIRACLNSIISQQGDFKELIVVDNNSNEETKKILKEFDSKYQKVKYIFEKKPGRGSARNAGVRAAHGEILLMTDSDCTVPKNWVKRMIKPLTEEGEKVVMGFQKDGINNYWTRQGQKYDVEFAKKNAGKYIPHLDTKNFAVDAKLMKKYLFDSTLKASEDLDFYLRVRTEHQIRFLKDVKVTHLHKFHLSRIIQVFSQRGFYSIKIIKRYSKNPEIKKILSENAISSNTSFFKLLFRFIHRLITDPLTCWYLVVIGVSWQIGALFGRFSKD